ncbi:MAG: Luciferase-like monooxygenase [Sphingomonas bacterium]|uniref:TIGR03619 family F420-dependent LLM class oxidoreductase n=1 Tax=Sphingomonas bacterium TaxID=1895847 RepID=UPI002610926E|nr:TIGR03619 family F420-dependent LLM class oxidoreductase [Sphingomonas bacterium]MDB5706598.1 Luciferase-like monooxygenase [Sphingomonas bacterium]
MGTLKFTVNGNAFTNGDGLKAMIPFAKEADKLGYDYLRLLDHVVGYVAEKHPEIEKTPYTHKSEFLEVFTLMAHLSAMTEQLGFITGVLGLPQRQTALVAKQAAQVDIMCGGRLILGVGIGYNSVEFEAMGAGFKDRAPRIEEQIDILRALWTQPEVSFEGKWHVMHDVNVNPLPIQQPIPIFMGAGRTAAPVPPPKVLERVAKYADGFMPLFKIDDATGKLADDALAALAFVREAMIANGRDPASLMLELGLYPDGKSDDQVKSEIDYLRSIGVTHVHARFPDVDLAGQIDFIRDFARIRGDYVRDHG